MASVTRTTTWSDNQVLNASNLNGEFNNLLNALNIVNADISGSAAIAYSKLSLTGSIVNADISAGAAISTSKISGLPTFPSGAVVGTTDSQTLTNKTLSNPTLNGTTQGIQTYSPAGGGTATLDLSLANVNFITMPAGNITIALSNASVGDIFIVRITQDGGGSRTVSWFSTIKWPGGTTPTLTTTGSKTDILGFICTSSGNYDGVVVAQNL